MSENDEIKICRWCHKVYSSPFCGNGCERRDFFKRDKIEPRELRLKPNKQGKIRWVCLSCKNEFTQKELEKHDFVCPNCGQKNDFYPFTKKECAICNEDGKARKLPLWAKACEKCGKNEFIINGKKKVSELQPTFSAKEKKKEETNGSKIKPNWEGPPPIFEMKKDIKKERDTKNKISLTFTVLNNNYEIVLFAESKDITLYEFIKGSNGFIPNEIYQKLLENYSKEEKIFSIVFNEEKGQFFIKSIFPFEKQELDPRYNPVGKSETYKAEDLCVLEENKLTRLKISISTINFDLKIQIWVY